MAEIIKEDIAKIKKLLKDVLGTDAYTSLERLGGLTNHTYHAALDNGREYVRSRLIYYLASASIR